MEYNTITIPLPWAEVFKNMPDELFYKMFWMIVEYYKNDRKYPDIKDANIQAIFDLSIALFDAEKSFREINDLYLGTK